MEAGVVRVLEDLAEAVAVVKAAEVRRAREGFNPSLAQTMRAACQLAEFDRAFGEARRLEELIAHAHAALRSVLHVVHIEASPSTWSAILRAMDLDGDLRLYLPLAGADRAGPNKPVANPPESPYRR